MIEQDGKLYKADFETRQVPLEGAIRSNSKRDLHSSLPNKAVRHAPLVILSQTFCDTIVANYK